MFAEFCIRQVSLNLEIFANLGWLDCTGGNDECQGLLPFPKPKEWPQSLVVQSGVRLQALPFQGPALSVSDIPKLSVRISKRKKKTSIVEAWNCSFNLVTNTSQCKDCSTNRGCSGGCRTNAHQDCLPGKGHSRTSVFLQSACLKW